MRSFIALVWCIHVSFNLLLLLPAAAAFSLRSRHLQEPPSNSYGELVSIEGELDADNGDGEADSMYIDGLRKDLEATRARSAFKAMAGAAPQVLLYVAAKGDAKIVDVVIGNVNHLRAGGVYCDVLLGHYDRQQDFWRARNGTWYNASVRWGVNEQGWKVHLFRTIVNEGLAPGLNLSSYDWVWLMDEDLDIRRTDVRHLFTDVESTGSLIVGPAFVQLNENANAHESDPTQLRLGPEFTEPPFYPMNRPQPGMRFNNVPMVEVIMPILRPQAVELMCKRVKFMAPQDHDWGMDHMWCSWIARSFEEEKERVCAIVHDTGPIMHLNYKSTRSTGGKAVTKDIGHEAIEWLKKHHHKDWIGFPEARRQEWPGYGVVWQPLASAGL